MRRVILVTVVLAALLLATRMPSRSAVLPVRPGFLFHRGSITVVDVDANRVILASDSRATLADGYHDDDCKISAFGGELVFSGAGYRQVSSTLPPRMWDSHEVALKSFEIVKSKREVDTVSATAREWERETKEFFIGPPDALQDLLDSGVSKVFDAVFVGKDGGRLVAIHDQFRIDPFGPHVEMTSEVLHPPRLLALGVSDIADEFANRTSPRAIAEAEKWRETVSGTDLGAQEILFAAQLVKWTVLYGPENVGGAVDTVVIDSDGVHWIDRKAICRERP
jgi:hypothetical protein